MTRTLVIANTEGGAHSLHVTAGADIDVIELNEFLTGNSEFGVDYQATDYVTYVDDLAQTIAALGPNWSEADRDAAQGHLDSATFCIRSSFGERLEEALDGEDLELARKLELLP